MMVVAPWGSNITPRKADVRTNPKEFNDLQFENLPTSALASNIQKFGSSTYLIKELNCSEICSQPETDKLLLTMHTKKLKDSGRHKINTK